MTDTVSKLRRLESLPANRLLDYHPVRTGADTRQRLLLWSSVKACFYWPPPTVSNAPGRPKLRFCDLASRASTSAEQSTKVVDPYSSMVLLGRWGGPEELAMRCSSFFRGFGIHQCCGIGHGWRSNLGSFRRADCSNKSRRDAKPRNDNHIRSEGQKFVS